MINGYDKCSDDLKWKIDASIARFKNFEPKDGKGFYLAFSGGKDSCVIKALADLAGVKYDAHYRVTGIDPPELVKFIREHHPDVEWSIPKYKDGSRKTMWNLIPKMQMPPTRIVRYCCKELKEDAGDGRTVVTGVRWAESSNRKNNQGIATVFKGKASKELENDDNFKMNKRGGVILVNDNEDARRVLEQCVTRAKVSLNPIIDWDDSDVWGFIRNYEIPYCKLYDDGWNRIGCIGCPMATYKGRAFHFAKYPKYEQLYKKAFKRMLDGYNEAQLEKSSWEDEIDVFHWWMEDGFIKGQTSLFEEEENG